MSAASGYLEGGTPVGARRGANLCGMDHEATKRSPLEFVWANDFLGLQEIAGETIALANCRACHTTLGLYVVQLGDEE